MRKPYPSILKLNTPEDAEFTSAVRERHEGRSKEAMDEMEAWYENTVPTSKAPTLPPGLSLPGDELWA
eukprot:2590114-Lingulodinium_polyedra.AAC.1